MWIWKHNFEYSLCSHKTVLSYEICSKKVDHLQSLTVTHSINYEKQGKKQAVLYPRPIAELEPI